MKKTIASFSLLSLLFITSARATDLVSNLGQVPAGGAAPSFAVGGNNGGSPPSVVGVSFTSGNIGATLDSVNLQISDVRFGSPIGGLKVDIYSSFSIGPSGFLGTFTNIVNPVTAGTYSFTGSGVTLAANTSYYLFVSAVTPTGGSDFYEWTRTLSYSEDASSLPGWSFGDSYYLQSHDFPNWITIGGSGVPMLALETSAVPEPSTYALFGLGALVLVIAVRRKISQ